MRDSAWQSPDQFLFVAVSVVVDTRFHILAVDVPTPPMADTAAMKIIARINPYSMAVAALVDRSSARNLAIVPPLPQMLRPEAAEFCTGRLRNLTVPDAPRDAQNMLLVVAAALVDRDGRILVQQRPAGKPMAGLWEFPGGKVEPGETPEAALIRELAEELAIDVDHACLAPACFASDTLGNRHLLLLLYVCRKWRGTPVAQHASALRWVRPVELYGLDMPPADLPLIGLLEALV